MNGKAGKAGGLSGNRPRALAQAFPRDHCPASPGKVKSWLSDQNIVCRLIEMPPEPGIWATSKSYPSGTRIDKIADESWA
jgi:hypothetical protein